ncbi:DUF6894 family protein [Bradyrhizobium sp. TZ2]
MPRYFFHLHGSGARDTEGQEFPDDEAARQEARVVARDLSQNGTVATDERLIVTNQGRSYPRGTLLSSLRWIDVSAGAPAPCLTSGGRHG